MSPKDKAKELVDKFHPMTYTAVHAQNMTGEYADAIRCALILVDEIINNYEEQYKYCKTKSYWHEVKTEIEKL